MKYRRMTLDQALAHVDTLADNAPQAWRDEIDAIVTKGRAMTDEEFKAHKARLANRVRTSTTTARGVDRKWIKAGIRF